MATHSAKVQILRLAFVTYQHPDLEKVRQFGSDFGFEIARDDGDRVYFCGYGPDPYVNVTVKGDAATFKGAAWLVESRAELEKAAKLPGASAISKLDGPGGGDCVTLTDPYGYPVRLAHGWKEKEARVPEPVVLNYPQEEEKQRRGTFQRFENGPAMIHKLGHWGYLTTDFALGKDWYTSTFNIRYSDVTSSELPDGNVVEHSAFFRLDRGSEYVDHHCFFIITGPPHITTAVHHSSYEVSDFDQQVIGHNWLNSKSYELSWGIGRHVLGSQIFDYWLDSAGFRLEHYCDGDVLNDQNETGRHRSIHGAPLAQEALASWALHPLTPAFTEIRVV